MITPLEPIRCGSPILSRQEIKVKEFLKLFLAFLAGFWNAFLHIGKGTALPFESVIVNTILKQKEMDRCHQPYRLRQRSMDSPPG